MKSLDRLAARFNTSIIPQGEAPVVYALCLAGEVVYVGSTRRNLFARLGEHQRVFPFDRALWLETTVDERLVIEGALVRVFRPLRNVQAPAYHGRDNEILESFGLPIHIDEKWNAEQWQAVCARVLFLQPDRAKRMPRAFGKKRAA